MRFGIVHKARSHVRVIQQQNTLVRYFALLYFILFHCNYLLFWFTAPLLTSHDWACRAWRSAAWKPVDTGCDMDISISQHKAAQLELPFDDEVVQLGMRLFHTDQLQCR